MAAQTPIKGQEVILMFLTGTEVQEQLTQIVDFSLTFNVELIEENYLGMTSAEFDEVFKGIRGDVSLQMSSKKVFNFVKAVLAKATRRTPGEIFSFKSKFTFPNGNVARILLPDVHFGDIPFNFGSRTAHGTMKIDFACSGASFISD